MASTAGYYQMDKEQQLSCWLVNEELGGTRTSEDLPEDYVTFDPCEFLNDPQSPSAVLDSVDGSMTDSSNDQGSSPMLSFTEADADSFTFPSAAAEQNNSPPRLLGVADPVLGEGLASDYELLQLEDISLKSAKADIPTGPSLLLPQSSPTTSGSLTHTVVAPSREATYRSDPLNTHTSVSTMDIFENDPGFMQHTSHHYDHVTDLLDQNHLPIDNNGLPLSPPLSSDVTSSGSYSDNMPFLIGELGDPFFGKATTLNMKNSRITTQADNNDFTLCGLPAIGTDASRMHQPKQRGTSSAEWPMEGIISDDTSQHLIPSSSAYIADKRSLQSLDWLEDTQLLNMQPCPPLHDHNTRNTAASFEHNNAIHDPQGDLLYDYTSELSDFMIPMSQSHQTQAAVLTDNIPNHFIPPTYRSHSSPTRPHSHHQHRGHYTPHHSQHRRSQPRSFGSETGHHHRNIPSPRRRNPSRSLSPGVFIYREESVSPSPSEHRSRRTTSSSGISIRKKRSWSRTSRTPRPASYSSSNSRSSSPPAGEGAGGIDFVNFTPGDKNLLMTGVAPSGSSKTKARREKEAADRRRMLNEAAVKAVVAAGGDLEKLVRDGFAFET